MTSLPHGNTKPPYHKRCIECGVDFLVSPPSSGKRRKFCSHKCGYANKGVRDSIGSKLRSNKGSSVCLECGKSFLVRRNSGKAKFCSQPCAAKNIGKVSIVTNRRVIPQSFRQTKCPTCGEHFTHAMRTQRIFCSSKCFSNNTDMKKQRISAFNALVDKSRLHSRSKKSWVELGGQRFYARSRWEANYGRYLEWLKEKGEIATWQHEPEVFWFDKIKRGVCSYLPDFRVSMPDESIVFHEVKGWMDAKSKTKIKRMAKYHPKIKLEVIDSARYRALAKQLSKVVPGWES